MKTIRLYDSSKLKCTRLLVETICTTNRDSLQSFTEDLVGHFRIAQYSMEDLIIITYNTNNYCTQSGDDSLGSILDLLRRAGPHVLCLQV